MTGSRELARLVSWGLVYRLNRALERLSLDRAHPLELVQGDSGGSRATSQMLSTEVVTGKYRSCCAAVRST